MISMAKLKVIFTGEAPGNIIYVLAKTTHDTRSGKGPENRLPETSINNLTFLLITLW